MSHKNNTTRSKVHQLKRQQRKAEKSHDQSKHPTLTPEQKEAKYIDARARRARMSLRKAYARFVKNEHGSINAPNDHYKTNTRALTRLVDQFARGFLPQTQDPSTDKKLSDLQALFMGTVLIGQNRTEFYRRVFDNKGQNEYIQAVVNAYVKNTNHSPGW